MDGNQMKMREALLNISAYAQSAECHTEDSHVLGYLNQIRLWVKAALSAPPRNCDRFADETDAQIAFLNEVWLISVTKETALERDRFENWTDEMRAAYAKWIFAPAEKGADA